MKKLISLILILSSLTLSAQINLGKLKKSVKDVSKTLPNTSTKLTEEEVVKGLKEALNKGAKIAIDTVSKAGGFNNNSLIRIPFPEDAKKAKELALKSGLKTQVDKFENTLNEAAEIASREALDILTNSITNMTVSDAFGILNGEDTAATGYLRKTNNDILYSKFKPIVEKATKQVQLTKHWEPITTNYNKTLGLFGEKINTDLDDYVTKKAINGLFKLVAKQEKEIRENPAARVTDILKKVFGS